MKSERATIQKIEGLIHSLYASRKKSGAMASPRVNVGWPVFDDKETISALRTILDGRISQGPTVKAFEAAWAKYSGVKHAVAVNSGSSANLLALTALVQSGKIPAGSEVIVPAATFATVASPVIQVGLIPVYVDVDPYTWNIDPKQIEKAITKKTKIIMPVHSFGNPADMVAIMKIAKKHRLLVLEDCCEAHGAMIGKKKVGSFGDMATVSFFVAHNITTGEGGMVFTNDKKLDNTLRSLREFGRLTAQEMGTKRTYHDKVLGDYDARYIFTRLGYNVRMTDITASIGLEQLKKLDALNRRRNAIVDRYTAAFRVYKKDLRLPTVFKGNHHTYYGYTFVIEDDAKFTRKAFTEFLEARGIETRTFFGGCLPDQPGFRDEPMRVVGKLPVSRWLRDRAVFIGCHGALSNEQVTHVIKSFKEFFAR